MRRVALCNCPGSRVRSRGSLPTSHCSLPVLIVINPTKLPSDQATQSALHDRLGQADLRGPSWRTGQMGGQRGFPTEGQGHRLFLECLLCKTFCPFERDLIRPFQRRHPSPSMTWVSAAFGKEGTIWNLFSFNTFAT